MIFQNYHRHSMYTNARIPDSSARNEDYAKRAVELEHKIISTMEHGWQGRYIEGYELSKKYDLKFLFGTEAYWVKDRLEKDNTNAHICIFAKNENGRQCINDILAEANISGFYYQPRLDLELILSLPKNDVWITSACLAFWKYKDDEIVKQLHNHFGNNFFLEVQYHNTDIQKEINNHILELSNTYSIPLIMGCDSHYINESDSWERDDFLKSKGIEYTEETGWFLDYPDGETAYKRFQDQNILNDAQIEEAINNTNIFLEVKEYKNPCFTKEIKMPSLYRNLSQEEKDKLLTDLIWSKWEEKKIKKPIEKHEIYIEEIQKELSAIIETKHSDYFLIDYELVKESSKRGAMITPSGRGSGASYFINYLLGITKVDRISAEVKMYPERFISPTRIIESKSLADLDLNFGEPQIAAEVQSELLGKDCSYSMIAYGTMQKSSAWKMYAKAQNVEFELANEVSKQIKQYENALKDADEEEIENMDIFDYVDEKYHETLRASEKYLGLIASVIPHPCGYLLYQGNIRREIGLIKIKSKAGKKEYLCAIMDGKWAEDYKFMKNDLLKVSVVKLIYKVYERIGQELHDVDELIQICKNDEKPWNIYKKGFTLGVNQVEQLGTKNRVKEYAPQNISELCAFIAAIRPGFKSMYKTFASRESFDYGIPTFDQLIQTPEMPSSFVLYQEMAMTALNFAGIPMSECYEIIKCISKKRVEKIKSYKKTFLKGFAERIEEIEHKSAKESKEIANKVWRIMEDSSKYSFNASHSYSVSSDSLYCAYLKSHYPLSFYEVFLNILEEKGQKDRISSVLKEAEYGFNIKSAPYKFRQDNRKITGNFEKNILQGSLQSIKGFGTKVAEGFYKLKENKYKTFIDLLLDISKKSFIDMPKLLILIQIDYFSEFGNSKALAQIFDYFLKLKQGKAKELDFDKISEFQDPIPSIISRYSRISSTGKTYMELNTIEILKEIEKWVKSTCIKDYSFKEKIEFYNEYMGYINMCTNNPEDRRKLLILDEPIPIKRKKDNQLCGYSIDEMSIGSGKKSRLTVWLKTYEKCPIQKYDVIYAEAVEENKKGFWELLKYYKIKI